MQPHIGHLVRHALRVCPARHQTVPVAVGIGRTCGRTQIQASNTRLREGLQLAVIGLAIVVLSIQTCKS